MIEVKRPEATYFLPHGLPQRKIDRFTINGSEPWLREYMCTLLAERPGSVISAGAYVGGLLAPLSAHATIVYAWEPVHEHYSCVERMLAVNGIYNVVLRQAALGKSHRKLQMTTGCEGAELLGGDSCVITEQGLASPRLTQGSWTWTAHTVAQHMIDDFDYDNLSILQLDLEGYEYAAIQGAVHTIQQHRPIIIAEHNDDLVAATVEGLGYSVLQERAGDVVYKYTKGM